MLRLKPFHAKVFSIIAICLLGIAVYSNTFYSEFHFDDQESIIDNVGIRDPLDLKTIGSFWPTRFMVYFSIALNYSLNRFNVFGYHLFNIIVHLCSAILVWWLAVLTLSTPAMKGSKIAAYPNIISFFAGLIFVAHPLQTQAVTYIIQRTTSLAALFYLLSLCLYIKSRLSVRGQKTAGLCYFGSLIACLMAMFTKEMTVTLPLLILLYELHFFKDKKPINWKLIVPFLFSLLIIPLTMLITKSVDFTKMHRISEPSLHISPMTYLLTEFRVIVTYLRLFFIPINQNLDYDYPISKSIFELPVAASILLLALLIFVAFRMFRNYKLLSFGMFWVFLTLLPESSIIPIRDVIFEHRLYLPIVGYSLFLTALIYYILGKKSIVTMGLMLVMLINWYALLTYTRNFDWHDNLSLWDDTVRKSPAKARPYFNRGIAYIGENEHNKALLDLNRSLMIYYKQMGMNQDYADDYNKLLNCEYGYAQIYNFLGIKFAEINLIEMATILFKKAINIHPSNIHYYINLCAAYGDLKKFKEAIAVARKAIELDPNSAEVHYNLSVAYYFDNQYNLAFKHLETATKLGFKPNPDFVAELEKAQQ